VQVAQLGSVLTAFAKALDGSGAGETAAHLRTVVRGLATAGGTPTQKFVAAIDKLDMSPFYHGEPTLGSVGAAIDGLVGALKEGGAKKPLIADLETFLDLINRHKEMSIAEFESAAARSVASASGTRTDIRGTGTVATNQLVDSYLQRLEAALGSDEFLKIHRELDDDLRITKADAVEIASRFFEPMPPSTPRRKAIQKVLQRHQKLMASRAASATIGGRAA
jgi:hypothetical protein